jgi:hypothetical protein
MPSSAAASAPAAVAPTTPAILASVEPSAAFAYAKYHELFHKLPTWALVDENTEPGLTPRALLKQNVEKVVDALELMLIALGQEVRFMEPGADEVKQMQAANILSLNRWIAGGCQMNGSLRLHFNEDDAAYTEEVRSAIQQLGQAKQTKHITFDKNLYGRFRKCFSRENWRSAKAKKNHFLKLFGGYKELLTSCRYFLDTQSVAPEVMAVIAEQTAARVRAEVRLDSAAGAE